MVNEDLRGIGGWLLFFVIVLMLVGPALAGISIMAELEAAVVEEPEWATTLDYEDAVMGAWFVWGFTTLLAVIAGLLLIFRRKPSSVWVTISTLWVIGPILNSLVLFDSYLVGESITAELWVGMLRSLIPAGIWTAYLLLSDRVANTYDFRRGPSSQEKYEGTKS